MGGAAAVEVAGGTPVGLLVALDAGAAVEAVEVIAAEDDDFTADELAVVVDLLVVLVQLVSIMVATTTTLSSAKTFWRLRPKYRVFVLILVTRSLPMY